MKDMMQRLRDFDKERGWHWSDRDFEGKVEALQYGVIALAEEVGEVAGPIKKMLREWEHRGVKEEEFYEIKDKIGEEVVDVMIYLMKMADLIGIDLEEEYYKKMERNDKRHAKYKR